VAIPAERNVVRKEAEKKLKYKSLCRDTTNVEPEMYDYVIAANGIVTRIVGENLEAVPGRHSTDSPQKTAKLGTSHVIRKVLQYKRQLHLEHHT